MCKFSVFEYFYRDAANYKSWGFLLLSGSATSSDIQELQDHFDSECFFIAEQLRIPPLYAELWALSNGPSSDDHVWHTYHALRPACAQDMQAAVFGSVESLIQTINSVTRWDETLSPHWDL